MAIPVSVGSHILLPKDIPDWIRNQARADLTFRNPALSYYYHRKWPIPEGMVQEFKGYDVSDDGRYYLPRGYLGRLHAIHPVELERGGDHRTWKEPRRIEHRIKLFTHQVEPTKLMLPVNEGMLEAPCGSGKSVMALWLACEWGQQTLVLAHTNQIMEQWIEYVEDLTKGKAGIIHGSTFEIRRITIASVMTLANRELSEEFLRYFGTVILDEAHHTPAYSFSTLLTRFYAKKRIGISATPRRTDGLQGLLNAIAGPVKVRVSEEELIRTGFRMRPTIYTVPTSFKAPAWMMKYENRLYERIEADHQRAKDVATIAYQNRKRSVLILSRRIRHLRHIYVHLKKMDPDILAVVLTGAVHKDLRKEIINDFRFGDLNIVLATQLADEGLDVPRLDTVLLSFPTGNLLKIEQQIGRAGRTHPDKKDVKIYDFMDPMPNLLRQGWNRRAFYTRHNYPIVAYKSIPKVP